MHLRIKTEIGSQYRGTLWGLTVMLLSEEAWEFIGSAIIRTDKYFWATYTLAMAIYSSVNFLLTVSVTLCLGMLLKIGACLTR